jgi:hypothetical protein
MHNSIKNLSVYSTFQEKIILDKQAETQILCVYDAIFVSFRYSWKIITLPHNVVDILLL